ncbi:MAG: translocation/assembly module TamB domain-containing protein, partial [Bacteroidales bacterium]
MHTLFNYIKKTTIGFLLILSIFYGSLYVLLSIDSVQQYVKNIVVRELSALLKTDLSIEEIQIRPFNKLTLQNVFIPDQQQDTLLFVNKISAGFQWTPILQKNLSFTTIQLLGFDARLSRTAPDAPLNIQFLLDAFASKDTVKKQFPFDLHLNSVFLRRGSLRYDDLSAPEKSNGFDKKHIRIQDLLATVSLRTYSSDSLNIFVKRLSLEEKSGFRLNKLAFSVEANRKEASLNNFLLQLPESSVRIDSMKLDYTNVATAAQFADSATFNIQMQPSQISLRDISAFTPALKHFDTPVEVELDANGRINQIEIPRLSVYADNEISLNATASLMGISHPSEAYIFGRVTDLEITPAGLMMIINNFSSNKRNRPDLVNQLGTLRFHGDISGFFTNLVAFGQIQSKIGTLRTDILLGKDFEKDILTCKGKLGTSNLKVGHLLPNNKLLDNLAFSLKVDLRKSGKNPITGKLDGKIPTFDFKGYRYENLTLNGAFKGKSFDGSVCLEDPNGHLEVKGKIDISPRNSLFNFSANAQNVRLGKLKLAPKYPDSDLSFRVEANFTGDKFDTAQGAIIVDSLAFSNNNETFLLNQLQINAFNHETPQVIQVNSDILKAQVRGRYSFAVLANEIRNTMAEALPIIASEKKIQTTPVNDFEFALQLNETPALQKVLDIPLSFKKQIHLGGFYNSHKKIFRLSGEFPEFQIGNMHFKDGNILADMPDDKVSLRFSTLKLNKNNDPISLSLNASAQEGELKTRFDWSNLAETTYSGNISTASRFTQRKKSKYPVRTEIEFLPSTLIFNDSIWQMQQSNVVIDSGRIEIQDFIVRHDKQHLKLDGAFSKSELDTLRLNLHDMSLDYIFQTLNMNFIMFGGQGTGEFLVSNQDKVPVIKTDSFKVKDFTYNGTYLGDLNLYSDWDAKNNGIRMNGKIVQPDALPTLIDGGIYLAQDSLWLNFLANRLNIGFVDIWTNKILSNLQGRASGDITLFGKFRTLNLVGDAWGENVNFGIDYLNTTYSITDSMHFRKDGISFKNIHVYDKNLTKAFASGKINYEHFKDISYDISFLIPPENPFQVFNVTEKINPVYWGTIYASGSARIHGNTEKTWIDVSARSNANSKFNFSLNENMTAGDYQFITFHDADAEWSQHNDDSLTTTIHPTHRVEAIEQGHELFLNLQMEATPDVAISLIMDPATGDMIKGSGSGNIRLEYNKTNDFKLYGNYTIDKGSYYFNLQDVITRDFSINQGSRVTFRGDPLNAELNIGAFYQVTANLTDLDESFSESRELSRTNVPVQCILNIKGDLRRPDLSFDINLPTVSQDIDRQVKSIISTDDMMNRQILYLMILNKFYTPEYANSGQQNRYTELTSVASSTLSSQLNNLLGQISDNWNIGTNIRSEKGDFSDVEVELALSSQLLNNRLLFNGNLGYRDNQNTTNAFIGDFDLEYLLNPAGSWRLKAYNHYND